MVQWWGWNGSGVLQTTHGTQHLNTHPSTPQHTHTHTCTTPCDCLTESCTWGYCYGFNTKLPQTQKTPHLSSTRTHTYVHTYIHTYIRTQRLTHYLSLTLYRQHTPAPHISLVVLVNKTSSSILGVWACSH